MIIALLKYIPDILVYSFFVILFIQLCFYFFIYTRLAFHKQRPIANDIEPVSVVICAKNEGENLEKFLPLVLNQDFENFEVIVVNDCSMDDTEMLLAQMKQKYSRLRFTTLVEDNKFKHGKKLAVTVGVKSAKHNNIIFTDADCYPETDKWLFSMQQGFGWGKEIILGYGGYQHKKTLLNKIIRFDSLFIAMNYIGFAKAHIPYMGIGRNLGYNRKIFFNNNGFASNYEINSGDDDILINETATSKNTIVILNKDSIVRTLPKTSLKEFYLQKKRHITTAGRYKYIHQFLLGLEFCSRFLFYCLLAPAIIFANEALFWYVIGGLGFRLLVQLLIVKLSMIKLNERKLLLYSPFLDVFLTFFYIFLFINNKLSSRNKIYRWK